MTSMELVHVPRQLPETPSRKPLAVDVAAYLLNKKKRLTAKSQRSYQGYLRVLVNHFPDHVLAMFEPPTGSLILEDFLNQHWGERAPATYNKAHSVLSDFFSWHVKRMNLMRDPMLVIEKAKRRQYHRTTISEEDCTEILNANPYPRAQIALRLLLFYGLRKGALQTVRFQDFNRERNELTIFTKGETIQRILTVHGKGGTILEQNLPEPIAHEIEAYLLDVGAEPDWFLLAPQRQARYGKYPLYRYELVTTDPRKPYTLTGITRWFERCRDQAGLPDVQMHELRHTAGTHFHMQGHDLVATQHFLRHRNPATTASTYVHLDRVRAVRDVQRGMVDPLDEDAS